MEIMAGLRRRLSAWGRRRNPRRLAPEVTALEGRELLFVNAGLGFLKVAPPVLAPSGQYTTVTVSGQIGGSRPVPPVAFYFVNDEYRVDEPHAAGIPLTLDHTRAGGGAVKTWYVYSYSFTIPLQAKRSTHTYDGRHYDIYVGATDTDGTDGQYAHVSVPKVYPPVTATHPKPGGHAHQGRGK
ncbi:MAG: hypothetical protein LC745_03100 [Planctomycetia bacterium]|nr:hypothetical protein [Planctomycetia bacterium]